jgi:hypothetical protein
MINLLDTNFVEIIDLLNSFFFFEAFLSNLFGHTTNFPYCKANLKVVVSKRIYLLESILFLFSHNPISILLFGMYNCNHLAVEFEMANYQHYHYEHFVETNE